MYARTDFVVWVCVFMCILYVYFWLKRFVFPQRVQGILHPIYKILWNDIYVIGYLSYLLVI